MVTSVRSSRLRIGGGRGYHPLPLLSKVYLSFKGIAIMTGNGGVKGGLPCRSTTVVIWPPRGSTSEERKRGSVSGDTAPLIAAFRNSLLSIKLLAFLANVYFALRMFSFLNGHVFSPRRK